LALALEHDDDASPQPAGIFSSSDATDPSGPVLVRVARSLTPAQAAEYQKALADIG
jgi:hypothetical protein